MLTSLWFSVHFLSSIQIGSEMAAKFKMIFFFFFFFFFFFQTLKIQINFFSFIYKVQNDEVFFMPNL